MIKPTVGRVVHYHDSEMSDQPCCAFITYVHDDRMVNLSACDCNGEVYGKTSVTLVQPGDPTPAFPYPYATWMPYQVKKDFGSESGEESAGQQEI